MMLHLIFHSSLYRAQNTCKTCFYSEAAGSKCQQPLQMVLRVPGFSRQDLQPPRRSTEDDLQGEHLSFSWELTNSSPERFSNPNMYYCNIKILYINNYIKIPIRNLKAVKRKK